MAGVRVTWIPLANGDGNGDRDAAWAKEIGVAVSAGPVGKDP